jgi:2-dehydro-3-deoxy-D-arabinonate dehydratase
MNICLFAHHRTRRVGVLKPDHVVDITESGAATISQILEADQPAARAAEAEGNSNRTYQLNEVELLAPLEQQEVWAAGVTYLRSKKARMEESEFSASAYDKVYEAARPEIFFKSMPEKVSSHGGPVGIRSDAKWNVPEPELALVVNSRGQFVGCTIGNDMSSRDIEGENLLYLPQAKIYRHSCALGPSIVLGATEEQARQWTVDLSIARDGKQVFAGQTSISQIKRSFDELIGYLCRSQEFPNGAVLLTGTGVVPADDFTLAVGDVVRITISGIGTLENKVVLV